MAYVINESCIGTKDTSCVEVCPVDCIHPTPDEPGFEQADQLYIDPEECIDCDACVEACPVDAITSEDMVPPRVAASTSSGTPPTSAASSGDPTRPHFHHDLARREAAMWRRCNPDLMDTTRRPRHAARHDRDGSRSARTAP